MAKRYDINKVLNTKFNRLLILKESEPHVTKGGNIHRTVQCACDCGITKDFQLSQILNGSIKSCGCYSRDTASKRMSIVQKTHGMTQTYIYNTWISMRKRCNNPNHKSYKDYGGRGIKVCDEWLNSFERFYSDMGDRPSETHSIDRRNNNDGYNKNNCYWATKTEQCRNQRNNVYITYKGETKCIAEWAALYNMNYNALQYRVFVAKWDLELCFTRPLSHSNR